MQREDVPAQGWGPKVALWQAVQVWATWAPVSAQPFPYCTWLKVTSAVQVMGVLPWQVVQSCGKTFEPPWPLCGGALAPLKSVVWQPMQVVGKWAVRSLFLWHATHCRE